MQVISCLGTRSDFSLFTMNPNEAKRWRHLSQSWHETCLNWLTTNQSSRYEASLMLWAATTATIFMKQGMPRMDQNKEFSIEYKTEEIVNILEILEYAYTHCSN